MAGPPIRLPSLRGSPIERIDVRAHVSLGEGADDRLAGLPRSGFAHGGRVYWYLVTTKLLPRKENLDGQPYHLSLVIANLGREAPRRADAAETLPDEVSELLAEVSATEEWEIDAIVEYPVTTRSLVQLPQGVEFPGFDELRGVRLVRVLHDRPEYSVVVDRFTGELTHQVWIRGNGALTTRRLSNWIRRVRELSMSLVVAGGD